MMQKHLIIGGGLAGLSAASYLKSQKKVVQLFEASKHLGGRCRSYFDPHLNMTLDNGNHLILGCNKSVFNYLKLLHATQTVEKLAQPLLLFDHRTQKKINPSYLELLKYFIFKNKTQKSDLLNHIALSIQNTAPEEACQKQLHQCLTKMFLTAYPGASIAYQPKINLTHSFITPAITYLGKENIETLNPLEGVEIHHGKLHTLHFRKKKLTLTPQDHVIFALPLPYLNQLFKLNLSPNSDFNPISNIHFKCEHSLPIPQIIGLTHATAHWIFIKKNYISVTISNTHLPISKKKILLAKIWEEIRTYFPNLPKKTPPHKLVIEKYATLKQTPQTIQKVKNLNLPNFSNTSFVGDWCHLTLPNTLESAILSGQKKSHCY